ncbi:hypothetical protein C2E23DRAFT_853412 [Lenzites betulinus]|nr:hypothetical protein C2E23DRAFT_853412 [Lenzites betulinus]
MPDAHFVVKVEDGDFECPATGRVGEVLVLDDDEEDEPLAIVVARRKAVCVVKSEPVEAKLQSSKPATKRATQSSAVKTKRRVASTTVKTEECGTSTTSGPVAAPPKKKRPTRAKGAKKTKVEPVEEGTINLARMSTTTAPSATLKPKKATKRAAPADKDAPALSELARKRPRKSKVPTKSQPGPTRQTAPVSNDGASAVSQPETAESSFTAIQMRISLRRTPSPPTRRESYKGNKHPPRTVAYVQEHLQALGTVHWDVAGFECMELSALPWLAGIAEQPHSSNESFRDEPRKASNPSAFARGVYDIIYAPDVPDQTAVDEEDVCIRLYAHGPLPASFLDALGRSVSIRRDEECSDPADTCMAERRETVGIVEA